jgi:hypothetical protein
MFWFSNEDAEHVSNGGEITDGVDLDLFKIGEDLQRTKKPLVITPTAEFSKSEKGIIVEIKALLADGKTKNEIGAQYSKIEIDGKKIASKRLGALIKEASKE